MPRLALGEECGLVFFELARGLADSWHVVTALWCFVPESDRLGWNASLLSLRLRGASVGICAVPLALPLSHRSEYEKWSNHFLAEPFYEHTTV